MMDLAALGSLLKAYFKTRIDISGPASTTMMPHSRIERRSALVNSATQLQKVECIGDRRRERHVRSITRAESAGVRRAVDSMLPSTSLLQPTFSYIPRSP